jgi:hypothetical protein
MELKVHMADIREVMGTKVDMVAINVTTQVKGEDMEMMVSIADIKEVIETKADTVVTQMVTHIKDKAIHKYVRGCTSLCQSVRSLL